MKYAHTLTEQLEDQTKNVITQYQLSRLSQVKCLYCNKRIPILRKQEGHEDCSSCAKEKAWVLSRLLEA